MKQFYPSVDIGTGSLSHDETVLLDDRYHLATGTRPESGFFSCGQRKDGGRIDRIYKFEHRQANAIMTNKSATGTLVNSSLMTTDVG